MDNLEIKKFLMALSKNNNKEWMADNRQWYNEVMDQWFGQVQLILDRLSKHNPYFATVEPKSTAHRINNNRMFNKDLPLYKDHISCVFAGTKNIRHSSFYMVLGIEQQYLGGGMYRVDKDSLLKIRKVISAEGDRFNEIINNDKFQRFYNGLVPDEQQLSRVPKGFEKEHPYAQYLKRKSFTVRRSFSDSEFSELGFADLAESAYIHFQQLDAFFVEALQ